MPSTYAHYRFGTNLLPNMPADVRRTIQRFRQLFDLGLHGPDIFYFSMPPFQAGVRFLSVKFHEQSGREFFQRVCRTVRMERSEAALSYLYGVLCHYCLDAMCHPAVEEWTKESQLSQMEIEAEFERFLLVKDGRFPPDGQELSRHIQLTPGECDTVAKFYAGANARNVRDCVKNMARTTRLIAAPEGARRALVSKSISILDKDLTDFLIPTKPNLRCAHLDEPLFALYQQAQEAFPQLLTQLLAHMTYNALFGEDFAPIFG